MTKYTFTSLDTSYVVELLYEITPEERALASYLDYELQITRIGGGNSSNSSKYTCKLRFSNSETGAAYSGGVDMTTDYITLGADETYTLATGRIIIAHVQESGLAPNVNVVGLVVGDPNGITAQAGLTIEIPRKHLPARVLGSSDFTDDDNPTISYLNLMGPLYVDSLQAAICTPDAKSVIVGYRPIDATKGGASHTFNLTTIERNALRAAAADSITLEVRFVVKTVIDGTTYHEYSPIRVMTVNTDGPILNASVIDINAATIALTGDASGTLVRDFSDIQCVMNPTAQKGATIVSYSITNGSTTRYEKNTTFNGATSSTFTFTATDSRGLTTNRVFVLKTIDYQRLTCNQKIIMVEEPDSDAQISLRLNGIYYNGSFGKYNNAIGIYVRLAKVGEEMSDWLPLTPLGELSGHSYTLNYIFEDLDRNYSYNIECKVEDRLMTVLPERYTATFKPVFDWSKTDFNFNVSVNIDDDLTVMGDVDIEGAVSIEGDPLADYVIETGTESMGTNGTWYWRKWKSGRADCYGVRNYGNMAVNTAWGNLYRSSSFRQDLPGMLFIDTPEVIEINYRGSNFGGWVVRHEDYDATDYSTGGFCLVRPASATVSAVYFGFNVIGRWK